MNDDRSRDGPRLRFWGFLPYFERAPGTAPADQVHKFQKTLASVRRTCPHDGSFMRIEHLVDNEADYVQTSDGRFLPASEVPEQVLVCPQCSYILRTEMLIEEARAQAPQLKRSENQFLLTAFALVVGCGLVAFLTGNLFLLIGGTLLAMSLFVLALLLRYQHWQAVHARMFETRPPVWDWLRYEFGS